MTFPVAFDAVLTKLSARVDGRELVAVAQRCDVARETYEKALDRGKLSVLHEEKMRGVHVLSVGNLGPGKDVEVDRRSRHAALARRRSAVAAHSDDGRRHLWAFAAAAGRRPVRRRATG